MVEVKPCTGCGECCLSEKCQEAKIAVGNSDEICPFLRLVKPGYYRCFLVELASCTDLEPIVKEGLGIGVGCTNEFKEVRNKK